MNRPPPSLETLKRVLHDVCAGYPVMKVALFGSLLNGKAIDSSDVDLLIDFAPNADIGLFEMGALKEDLESQLGCPVDVVSRSAVEKSTNSFRKQSILNSPLTIYVSSA